MNVCFTETFKRDFLNICEYERLYLDFCDKFKSKLHKLIDLKHPYKKFKFDINWTALRWIVVENNWRFIPIFIIKKSNKLRWENLVIDDNLMTRINHIRPKIIDDMKNWKYEIY